MESAFPLFLPECIELTPFHGALKTPSQPTEPEAIWRSKINRLAERKLSWEECFGAPATEICKEPLHPAFRVETTHGGHTLLHLAIYQNRQDWTDSLLKIPSLVLRRNKYGLTASELRAFLGRSPTKLPLSLDVEPSGYSGNLEGIEHLLQPQFESEKLFDLILEKTAKAKREDSIPPEKIWMGIYFDREIQKGYHPRILLRWIGENVGFGVFAEQRILSCAFVGEYTGVVSERTMKHVKSNNYCVRYTTWDLGFKKFVLNAERKGNFTRFINHSATPNLGLQSIYWRGLPRMILISLREIQKGEQLLFDYGNLFWKECRQTPIPL